MNMEATGQPSSILMTAARTKAGKVRLIGNSVAPEVAEAVVTANLPAADVEGRRTA